MLLVIDRLIDWFEDFHADPVVKRVREGLLEVESLELGIGTVIDTVALHTGLQVGQIMTFGFDRSEDCVSIYDGIETGWHKHQAKIKAGGRAARHTHARGAFERLSVERGTLVVYVGEDRRVLNAGDSITIPGCTPHALKALDREVDLIIRIEVKD